MAKILIVEDDPLVSRLYQKIFTFEKYEVEMAGDGEEGLKKALQGHPDLILLDIIMPKMDGMTVLQHLRADTWGKDVPVIILTNLDTNDAILQGVVKDQPAYYIIKSNVDHKEVVEKVKSILDSRKKEE